MADLEQCSCLIHWLCGWAAGLLACCLWVHYCAWVEGCCVLPNSALSGSLFSAFAEAALQDEPIHVGS
jgi:hypothetical protein